MHRIFSLIFISHRDEKPIPSLQGLDILGRDMRRRDMPARLISAWLIALLFVSTASYWPTTAHAANPLSRALQAASEVSGNVFADYNADGIDAGPTEHGIPDILVRAFDTDNNPIGDPVTTNANGDYTIAGLADGQQIRVEFTLPSELSFMRPGAADLTSDDAGSGSTVLFATAGDTNANVGFNNPADYCQANPDVVISCFVTGANDGPNASDAAMVTIPFNAEGSEQDQTTKLNAHQDVGTVYGIAYQKTTERIYAAAYLKRFTDFGPGGPDAIYQVDLSGTVVGTINLSDLTGTADVAGTDPHDFSLDPAINEIRDDAAYSLIGKGSLGDVELSDDMNTLYVVNMADRKIYAIDISAGDAGAAALVNSWDAPDACGDGSHRPMGLAWRNEKLWVGSVCENISGAHVHSLEPAGTTFDLEVTVPLDYTREQVLNVPGLSTDTLATWNAWSDDPTLFSYSFRNDINEEFEITYPQPMLSDIEFDGPHMILGFRDRFGDQTGFEATHVPAGSGTDDAPDDRLYDADAVGDILRICSDGTGGWTVETGASGDCSPQAGAVGPQPDSGPNGQEYYYWDNYPTGGAAPSTPNLNIEHYETGQGGLLQVQGSPSIMLTAMDPFRSYSAGVLRLDNITGQRIGVGADDELVESELAAGAYELYNVDDQPSTFGKANGLGDIEAMCRLAPLEIGNYVWLDTDGDGIQDPGETGIPGVALELYQGSDLVGTTTTNEDGQYIFGGINDTGMSGGPLLPNTDYQIRIALDDAALPENAQPTAQDYNGDAENGNLHDADGDNGTLNAGFSTVEVTTGAPGGNDHTFDFGFTTELPEAAIQIEKTVYLGHDSGAGCPGEELATGAVGAEVTYCFVVTNTGGTYLNDIILDDTTLGISRTDLTQTSGTEPLAPNASLVFYYETTLAGPLVNTANTSGTPTDPEGNPIPGLENPTDEDDAEVATLGPAIQIDKTVYLGHDSGAGCPGEELATGAVGAEVTYCFVITNTGDTYLNDITVDDATLGITRTDMTQTSGTEPLAPDASLVFYYETTLAGPLVNTANTSGTPTDAEGNPIPGLENPTDEDDAEVTTLGPAIQIDKTVYLGHDSGAGCPGEELVTGAVGAEVTYCFVITNTGDTYLNEISVDDATLGITRTDMTQTSGTEPLAPNASLTFYYETTLAGPLINTANTSGTPTDAEGTPIPGLENPTDEDDAEVDTLDELAAIGDFVWLDTNADGIQDPGELGLPGISVNLYDEAGSVITETITDAQGKYLFEDLQPGTYSIGFLLPSSMYARSPQDVTATTDALDSDADVVTGRTEPTELTAGEVDLTWDAGIYGLPELTLSKESDLTVVQPGGKIVYTIKYANTGIGRATNVIVTENVPLYTRFVPEESSPFVCMDGGATGGGAGGSICTYNVGDIEAPSSGTFELTFVVVADTAIPENVKIIENVVSIDDGGPAGLSIDGVVIQIRRPTAVDLMNEPEETFFTRLYIPMIQ